MAATSLRRNTFVLHEYDGSLYKQPSTGVDKQNVMRLKVNRIALIQELRVEHVIGPLFHSGVLQEADIKQVCSGRTQADKARILIDLLPTKSKQTEWYKHFRESLANPDCGVEAKRRYRLLVEFLDNTVIHRPTSQATRFRDSTVRSKRNRLPPVAGVTDKPSRGKLQHFPSLPDIAKGGKADDGKKSFRQPSETDGMTDLDDRLSFLSLDSHRPSITVKGYYQQWLPTPENFRTAIEIDKTHWDKLARSDNPEDQILMGREEVALNNLRRLEVIATLAIRKQLPAGFELCLSDAVQDILSQPELSHLYLKHLINLESSDINLIADLCSSYDSVINMLGQSTEGENVQKVLQTGIHMADFFIAVNKLSNADHVLSSIVHVLKENTTMETWVMQYQAYTKLMLVRNLSCQPDKAQSAYFDAVQMGFQIDMMSFGQTIVHQGALHAETSFMLLEYGSIISAHGWARRALAEIDPEDPAAVVRALCVGVCGYCAQWQAAKAETIAIYLVQYAREKFGERHPMYIDALLYFLHFNNEFKQDKLGVQVANELLEVVDKTYGGIETIQLAMAHRAASKTLMSAGMTDADAYYSHAMEAIRIARSILGTQSPLLHLFLHTFATALQCKTLHCPKEVYDSTLIWAETEAKQALNLVSTTFGEISLKSSQMLLLLGQIYLKMNRHTDIKENLQDVAERHLCQAVEYLKLCQPPSSNYLLLAMAAFATFYKIVKKVDQALPLFRYIIDHVESTGWYLKWVFTCFQSISSLYTTIGQTQEVDNVHIKLSHWLKANPVRNTPLDPAVLKEKPFDWTTFATKSDLWMNAIQKVMAIESTPAISLVQTNDQYSDTPNSE